MNELAKYFFIFGLIFISISGLIWLSGFLPFHLGKLPGDIHIEWERGKFYFPIVTSIILSIVLTVVLNLVLFLIGLFNR